jgi:hypothetical protein
MVRSKRGFERGGEKWRAGGINDGAAVVTVRVTLAASTPSSVTVLEGEIEHAASCGAPLHPKDIWELNPKMGVKVTLYVAVWPGATDMDAWVAAIEKSMLPPDREITCGLLGALSVRVSVPVRVPPAVGVKLTLRLHEPCGATGTLQVFV